MTLSEPPFTGCLTGLVDMRGTPVRYGDTLQFNMREWGGRYTFVMEYDPVNGCPHASDVAEWCWVIEPVEVPR